MERKGRGKRRKLRGRGGKGRMRVCLSVKSLARYYDLKLRKKKY